MAGVTIYGYSNNTVVGTNMEDNPVVRQPGLKRVNRRSDVLAYLRSTIRENGDFIHFPNKLPLFKELYNILGDSKWEIRHECLQLINELIPICSNDLNPCMEIVLPRVIRNMGHPKVVIRRATIQTLHNYMKHTDNVQKVLQAIVSFGLESEQGPSQECTVLSIPMLLTPEFDKENYTILVEALARQLVLGEDDKQQAAFFSLQKVNQLVGEERFRKYLQKLHPRMVEEYAKLLRNESNDMVVASSQYEGHAEKQAPQRDEEVLEFGIVPQNIMSKLTDVDNWKARCQGTEALKYIISDMSDVSPLLPHIGRFLVLLNRLVSDLNFKITSVSLEIYRILIDKVKYRIRPHLATIVNSLSRHLADSKIVVRSGCIKALTQLMQCVSPTPVITVLIGNLQHRSSRLREESINLITAALLTFPSYEFDLLVLCNAVAPMLTDPKRKIRQSVLECLAVLSQALGPSRSSTVLEIVDSVQRKHGLDRIVVAVQARLARRMLPRITSDGLVEYSVHIPNSAGRRGNAPIALQGTDIDWILAGSGSLSSGSGSARTESERDTSSSTSRSSPLSSFSSGSPAVSRRIVSPGRNRSRLPWEEGCTGSIGRRIRAVSDDGLYAKTRGGRIAAGEDESIRRSSNCMSQSDIDFKLSRNGHVQPHLPPGTSQKQVYLQKLRHQADKNGEKVPINALGVSILPNKPRGVIEDENSPPRGLLRRASNRNFQLGDISLSSTWPLQGPPPLPQVRRKVLDPIQGSQGTSNVTDSRESLTLSDKPVPTKPAIVRSSSAHKHKKVPPICSSRESFTLLDVEGDDELQSSDQSRPSANSATSQQSVDTVEDLETHYLDLSPAKSSSAEQSVSPSPQLESEWSTTSRSSSGKPAQARERSLDDDDEDDVPFNSMLMHSSASSSLKTVSRPPTDPHTPPDLERTLDTYRLSAQIETLPRIKSVGVGNGVQNRLVVDGLKQHEPDYFSSDYGHLLEDYNSGDEEPHTMSMSRTTRDRLLFKKQEMLVREAEKRRSEQQRKHQEQNEVHLANEDDFDGQEFDDVDEGYHPSVPLSKFTAAKGKPPIHQQKRTKSPQATSLVSGQSPSLKPKFSTNKPVSENDIRPFKNPENALHEAVKSVNNSEWTAKCEGLQILTRLACHHPDVLVSDLHNTVVLLLREVKNLRSSVSRAAIVCIGNLFVHLRKHMENDVEAACKVLLHKSGDTNKFIQDDVEKSLMSMIDNITPPKAGLALIQGGASHKNATVRKLTAFLLTEVTHNLGAAKLLSGTKDITDKFLVTASQFVMDNSPHTRYYGRLIFHQIIYHPQFETMLQKFVPANMIRNIRTVLDGIKTKGPGEKPSDSPFGRTRKSEALSKTM